MYHLLCQLRIVSSRLSDSKDLEALEIEADFQRRKEKQLSAEERTKQRSHQVAQDMAKDEVKAEGGDAEMFTRTHRSMDGPKDLEALEK